MVVGFPFCCWEKISISQANATLSRLVVFTQSDLHYSSCFVLLERSLVNICIRTAPEFNSTKPRSRFLREPVCLHIYFSKEPIFLGRQTVWLKRTKQGCCERTLKREAIKFRKHCSAEKLISSPKKYQWRTGRMNTTWLYGLRSHLKRSDTYQI